MSNHSNLPAEVDEAVRSFIRRHKRGLRWTILVGLVLAVVLAIAAAWAAVRGAGRVKDWFSGYAAVSIPLKWEQPLGEAALAQMRSHVRFITDPKVVDPLNRLAAPLFASRTNSADRFTLFVADSREINACALPGGFIVLNRGLLERARAPEEIQGVLAHEMAHVTKRHGILQLAQTVGMDLILQQIQSDEKGIQDAVIRDSAKLLGSKFSRDQERAADDLGWELLREARINPQGMVDFFAAIKAEMDAKGPGGFALGASLLSTHPTPQERIDRLRQRQTTLAGRDSKSSTQEFHDLQAGLRITIGQP